MDAALICPYCGREGKVEKRLYGERKFAVICTNQRCAARWPLRERRHQAIEEFNKTRRRA